MTRASPKRRGWLRLLLWLIFLPILLVVAAVVVFAVNGAGAGYPADLPRAMPRPGYLAGAYHVHSTASDGEGTVEEIAAAAKSVGLGFVVITDHNVGPRDPVWMDGVLVVFGTELSSGFGHVVALGLDSEVPPAERGPEPLAAIGRRGGVAVLAHPVQQRNPWRQWEPLPQVAGLELYSADTMLREALAAPFSRLLPAVGGYLGSATHGLMSMVEEQPETVRRLLQLSAQTPRVALCAHDAHGTPGYSDVFRVMATFVPISPGFALPEDPKQAARWLLDELLSGDALCVFRALGPPDGFRIEGPGYGHRYPRGTVLRVIPPRGTPDLAELRVHGAGRLKGRWQVELEGPGAVHLELWRPAPGRFFGAEWKPWIVTSPVVVE